MQCGVGSRNHILWRSGATPHLGLPIMLTHLGHRVYFIMRSFVDDTNLRVNRLNEYGKGSKKMN